MHSLQHTPSNTVELLVAGHFRHFIADNNAAVSCIAIECLPDRPFTVVSHVALFGEVVPTYGTISLRVRGSTTSRSVFHVVGSYYLHGRDGVLGRDFLGRRHGATSVPE